MKRQLMTAAMIGTSILAIADLAAAKECYQASPSASATSGEAMRCREFSPSDLGDHYCLVPDAFGIRAIKPATQSKQGESADPWVTKYPIELEDTLPDVEPVKSSPCQHNVHFAGRVLTITKNSNGSGYIVGISEQGKGSQQSIPMTATQANKHDVWLTGVDPGNRDMNYFVLLRDKPDSDHTKLPKFVLVEAFDFSSTSCRKEAPSLGSANTVMKRCRQPSTAKHDGLLFESGVGGGGERP